MRWTLEEKPLDSRVGRKHYYPKLSLQQGCISSCMECRCSVMICQHMLRSGTDYDYIIRLRPDTWIHMPMPPIRHIVTERNVVKYSHPQYYPGGNVDWFGVGHASAMLPYLERYLALPTIGPELRGIRDPTMAGFSSWRAEMFLEFYLRDVYNISLLPDERIAAGIVKLKDSGQSVP